MVTRNIRCWHNFLDNLLYPPTSNITYDGVCVFTLSGYVEYYDGCFRNPSDDTVDVDVSQFLCIFQQLTCQEIQREKAAHQEREAGNFLPLKPALRLREYVFHIVSATFTSVFAVGSGRSRGLVLEKLPFGVIVVAFSTPLQLKETFARINTACAALRR
ncbi:hypothetical protein CCR75_007892 [Bremia lactucae]|uniref:Uncharacterized protein n=1 Tax=Bremia lactucae TaxID=4779 RepID=A0A976FK00_BRELC|nr:hypothetical protein CCR75_007892 [Bremia lactucae]